MNDPDDLREAADDLRKERRERGLCTACGHHQISHSPTCIAPRCKCKGWMR